LTCGKIETVIKGVLHVHKQKQKIKGKNVSCNKLVYYIEENCHSFTTVITYVIGYIAYTARFVQFVLYDHIAVKD